MLVIGLGYKARQGKNHVAKTMIAHAATKGLWAKDYGFADALKAVCRVQFGMTTKDAPLLQMVGTDLYRRQHPNVWVDALWYRMSEDQPDVAIITDMRFANELAMVRNLGGYAVQVQRVQPDGTLWTAPDRNPQHLSETALDGYLCWNATITAPDRQLGHLEEQARFVFEAAQRSAPCPV